jgi:hypothetical protein
VIEVSFSFVYQIIRLGGFQLLPSAEGEGVENWLSTNTMLPGYRPMHRSHWKALKMLSSSLLCLNASPNVLLAYDA